MFVYERTYINAVTMKIKYGFEGQREEVHGRISEREGKGEM